MHRCATLVSEEYSIHRSRHKRDRLRCLVSRMQEAFTFYSRRRDECKRGESQQRITLMDIGRRKQRSSPKVPDVKMKDDDSGREDW